MKIRWIVILTLLIAGGCQVDPYQAGYNQRAIDQANFNLNNPASITQQAAATAAEIADRAAGTAAAIPYFPYKSELLMILGVVSAIGHGIQGASGKKKSQAIREIVKGAEAFKDQTGDQIVKKQFNDNQATAQSAATRQIVAAIKAEE